MSENLSNALREDLSIRVATAPGAHAILAEAQNLSRVFAPEKMIDELKQKAQRQQQVLLSLNPEEQAQLDTDQAVLALYGSEILIDEHIMDFYEELDHDLYGAIGEPVLAIKQRVKNNAIRYELELGVLEAEHIKFDIAKKLAYLPTKVHIYNNNDPENTATNPVRTMAGPINVTNLNSEAPEDSPDLAADIEKRVDTKRLANDRLRYPALQIICGLEKVNGWLAQNALGQLAKGEAVDVETYQKQQKTARYMASILRVDGLEQDLGGS